MTTEIVQTSSDRPGDNDLAGHAAMIRTFSKRFAEDIIEIGRHLTKAKAIVGHGHFGSWIAQEFGWSASTALNFMRVYELSLKAQRVVDLNLPMRELYLLAAPSTPEEACTEIIRRVEAGGKVSGAEVKETIARAKARENDASSTSNGNDVDTAKSARRMVLLHESAEHAEGAGDDHAGADNGAAQAEPAPTEPTPTPMPTTESEPVPELAPDPVATAVAAVNQLLSTQLQDFLDRLWPAHKRAFELKFGARASNNTDAEIVTVVDACSALLAHPPQNTGDIRKKLARIKTLVGGGKARTTNAQLDRGAFTRSMGMTGQTDKKFPTMDMTPNGVDESGQPSYGLTPAGRSRH